MKTEQLIPMTNFPKSAKLCHVNPETRQFRLGSLSFEFPKLFDDLKQHRLFLEHLLVFKVIDTDLPKEYVEEVDIIFEDNEGSHNNLDKGTFVYKGFMGLLFKNEKGIILKVGVEATGNEKMIDYVFEYNANRLTVNCMDYIDLHNAVNEI